MKTKTYAAIANADGLKTSIATATTPQTYQGGALNGAAAGAPFPVARTVSVTTSAATGAYNVGALGRITITGEREAGGTITEVLELTDADGDETISGSTAFKSVSKIEVPAMADTEGAFTFGVVDLVTEPDRAAIYGFRAGTVGNVAVQYRDGSTDTIPMQVGERVEVAHAGFAASARHVGVDVDHRLEIAAILSTGTTALPLTVYCR
jgi:hypothetical protein